MIYLIWTLINAFLILYFFYLIIGFVFKGKQFLKTKFKSVSIAIMIIGIVQIISATNLEERTNRISISNNYDKHNDTRTKKIVLAENLVFDINIFVQYSVDGNKLIPIESNSYLTGLISGYAWEFKSIQTNTKKIDQNENYIVDGVLKWNLFGINVYSQTKTFSGIIK